MHKKKKFDDNRECLQDMVKDSRKSYFYLLIPQFPARNLLIGTFSALSRWDTCVHFICRPLLEF